MSQPAKAKLGQPPAEDPITIVTTGSGYSPNPANSSVANDGEVHFICGSACWIWTFVDEDLVNVFGGEVNHYVPCIAGNNGPFAPAVQDETITFVPSAVNSNPPLFPDVIAKLKEKESVSVEDIFTTEGTGAVEETTTLKESTTFLDTFTVHGTIKVGSG
jgi:hypothetical protein